MERRLAERINMGDADAPVIVDLYEDSEAAKDTSYMLRGYRVFEALRKGPKIEVGKGIRVYSAKLPQYQRTPEGIAINAGFIEPSPKDKGIYWLVIDERLTEHERLAVISHELAHLKGGGHDNEKETQKLAIQTLTSLVQGYKVLSTQDASETLQKESRIRFNAGEVDEKELTRALQYLINSGKYFGTTRQDWYDAGLKPVPRKGLDSMIGIFIIILGLIPFLSLSITGSVIGSSYEREVSIAGASLIIIGMFVLGFSKLRKGKIIK